MSEIFLIPGYFQFGTCRLQCLWLCSEDHLLYYELDFYSKRFFFFSLVRS